jgi:hypothetical protein
MLRISQNDKANACTDLNAAAKLGLKEAQAAAEKYCGK